MLTVVSTIFDPISALGPVRIIFIGHWDYAWFDAVGSPVRYDEMFRGAGVSLIYVAVSLVGVRSTETTSPLKRGTPHGLARTTFTS